VTIIVSDTTSNDQPDSSSLVSDRDGPGGKSLVSEQVPDAAEPQPFDTLLRVATETPGDIPPVVTAQVVTADGQDVVLIGSGSGTGGAGDVDVLSDTGTLTQRDRYATATPVIDPDRRERVLRLALSRLATRYRETLDAVEAQRRTNRANANVLSQIRGYVIEWHRDDEEISRDSLDAFLSRFDLPPYRPTVRIEYTITGSYVINDSTTDEARDDAKGYLRPDLSQLDRVDDDSDTYTVSIDGVDNVDDGADY
jgi:hypothetical protein